MDSFDYISIMLFIIVVLLIFSLRQVSNRKKYYEKKAIREERLKEALEQELNFPNVDWQEYEEIDKSFENLPSDLWNKNGIEGFKEFKKKYNNAIVSFYKKKQGR